MLDTAFGFIKKLFNGAIKKEKKPVFVIIGETHLTNIEESLILGNLIKVKEKNSNGRNRRIVDIKEGGCETTKNIRLLHKGIIKKEADILKKEGIKRLFLEIEASPAILKACAKYNATHNLKQLKEDFREIAFDAEANARTYEAARKFLVGLHVPQPILAAFERYRDDVLKTGSSSLFEFYYLSVVHSAGVQEIIPAEDEKLRTLTDTFSCASRFANYNKQAISAAIAAEKTKDNLRAEAAKFAIAESDRIRNIAYKKIISLSAQREEHMHRIITENYAPGSALICGKAHVEPLATALSANYKIKKYYTYF